MRIIVFVNNNIFSLKFDWSDQSFNFPSGGIISLKFEVTITITLNSLCNSRALNYTKKNQ